MIMNTKFKRPKFTTEFKQGAVKRVTEQGYTRQARPGTKQESLNLSERNELEMLRKENAKLLMEKEILKKAAVFFAKESE